MTARVWLSGQLPNQEPSTWPLSAESTLIGREAPADIVVPLPRISRRHALIKRLSQIYHLSDLNSRNGTFLNGAQLTGAAVHLRDGDEVVLGGVVTFQFHDPGQTAEGPRLGRLRGVWIDEPSHEVWVDGRPLAPSLSVAQFALLKLLYSAPGQVFSRPEVIAAIWPGVEAAGVSEEAVDGLIKRLRARLREAQPETEYIEVLRGHGLRLIVPA